MMTFEEISKLFVPVIENLNVLLYLTIFVRKWKYSKKTTFLAFAALVLLLLTPYNVICGLKFGSERAAVYLYTPYCHLLLIVFILLLGKMEQGRLLFSISASYMLLFLCSSVTHPFEVGSYYFQSFVRLIFFVIFVWLSYRYLRPQLSDAMNWIEQGWYPLSLIPLSLIPLFLYAHHHKEMTVFFYALSMEGFLIYAILLWLFSLLKKQHQMEREQSLLQTHVSAIRQHCDQLQDINLNMRIIRHDIRHYCQLMDNAVSAGDLEQTSCILEQMKQKINSPQFGLENTVSSSPESTQNSSSVNSLLAYYKHLAGKYGISMKVCLVMPSSPSFDVVEFCVLISNGVENAINACIRMPNPEKRKIVISGEMKSEQFFFEIKNTYQGTVNFENHRPVSNEAGHGYGIQSICGFASKYDALLDFQADGTWFRLRLLI